MSLPAETVLTPPEAYPYVLLFPLVPLEDPVSAIAAGPVGPSPTRSP